MCLSSSTIAILEGSLVAANDCGFTQSPGESLAISLNGVADWGRLDVAGESGGANLAGTLRVSLGGGFMPAAGDSFGILTAHTHRHQNLRHI